MTEEITETETETVEVVDTAVSEDDFGDVQIVTEIAEVSGVPARRSEGGAVGRRKEAVARVRLVPGSGKWDVNGRSLAEYFPDKVHQQLISSPFVTTDSVDQYDVYARIDGGGESGQAGALRLGIARALNGIDEEAHRPALKKAGFLTRDARVKERKKYGLKKARKAPQYSKR